MMTRVRLRSDSGTGAILDASGAAQVEGAAGRSGTEGGDAVTSEAARATIIIGCATE